MAKHTLMTPTKFKSEARSMGPAFLARLLGETETTVQQLTDQGLLDAHIQNATTQLTTPELAKFEHELVFQQLSWTN